MLTGDTTYATASIGYHAASQAADAQTFLDEIRRILREDLARARRTNDRLRWGLLSLALAFIGWMLGILIRAHL